ncbi:MAG: polysaccharide deacetylase family protein [Legionellaceae bacterium]|nr:polysaccharide deacetylase family protein [Legionellaceae bacterium]
MSQTNEVLFERQLRWIMQRWDIVTPENFAAMLHGKLPVKRDTLLLTFDDGTVSNYHVAERVLKPLGIQALYFVVTQYALLGERDDWRNFAAHKIMLHRNPKLVPENFRNMSIANLQSLVSEGHTIGAHTNTHARLSTLTGESLHQEIVEGADLLEGHLNRPVRHFAYPFGNFESISTEASQVARQRFDYVYSGMRGDNGRKPLAWHLRRDSNNPYDTRWYTGACLEGGADFPYTKKYKICSNWVS